MSETILVIDDGRDNRDFLVQYIIQPNGFKPLTANDGEEGLRVALKHHPDLILLDLQMPRMNGIEFLHELGKHTTKIPVILMTFHGSEEVAVEVYRLGVKDYVKKPFTPEEMLIAIERSLSEVRLLREKELLTQRVIHANRELKSRIQELNILYKVGKNVTSIMDIDQLLPHIVDSAIQLTEAESGFVHLVEKRQLVCHAFRTHTMASAHTTHNIVNDKLALHVVKNKQPIILNREQMNNYPDDDSPICLIYQPLLQGDHLLGILGVTRVNKNAADFSQHHISLISALSDYATIAIENSHNYEALKKAEEQVRGTFQRFVPPSVVDQALADPGEIQLGGIRREVSVLFADIRGYTTWSETVSPETVVEVLNHYLSLAAEIILGWEGTLDKFFGDGLMAIFNAPEEQPDHVHRATDAALALIRAAEEVNQRYGHELSYSVGVNVGEAVVGYIGTERALNYTAIGDVVNLAKRLQETADPGQIFIDEAVVRRLGDKVRVNQIGVLTVKGRQQSSMAYRLLDLFD